MSPVYTLTYPDFLLTLYELRYVSKMKLNPNYFMISNSDSPFVELIKTKVSKLIYTVSYTRKCFTHDSLVDICCSGLILLISMIHESILVAIEIPWHSFVQESNLGISKDQKDVNK